MSMPHPVSPHNSDQHEATYNSPLLACVKTCQSWGTFSRKFPDRAHAIFENPRSFIPVSSLFGISAESNRSCERTSVQPYWKEVPISPSSWLLYGPRLLRNWTGLRAQSYWTLKSLCFLSSLLDTHHIFGSLFRYILYQAYGTSKVCYSSAVTTRQHVPIQIDDRSFQTDCAAWDHSPAAIAVNHQSQTTRTMM